jgi:hypothetical protein
MCVYMCVCLRMYVRMCHNRSNLVKAQHQQIYAAFYSKPPTIMTTTLTITIPILIAGWGRCGLHRLRKLRSTRSAKSSEAEYMKS